MFGDHFWEKQSSVEVGEFTQCHFEFTRVPDGGQGFRLECRECRLEAWSGNCDFDAIKFRTAFAIEANTKGLTVPRIGVTDSNGPAILWICHERAGHENPAALSVLHLHEPVQMRGVRSNTTEGGDVFDETA